jgi:telomere length regulation protein
MSDFLTAVSTRKVKTPEPLLEEVKSLSIQDAIEIDSTKSALAALKSQPSQDIVTNVLRYMTQDGFSLLLPEPLNASIAHQLVNDTLPHYWKPLRRSPQARLFAQILRNPTGLGHVITRLRALIADSRQKKAPGETHDPTEQIEDLLDVLDVTLSGDETSNHILQNVQACGKNAMQRKLIWREYVSQTASGRLVSIVAEAEDVLKSKTPSRQTSWLADGSVFAKWLGRNIAVLTGVPSKGEESTSAVVDLCSKALTLGYIGEPKLSIVEDGS